MASGETREEAVMREARGKEYGNVNIQALIFDHLSNYFQNAGPNWYHMTSVQRQSLTMIALKISRILAGNPHNADSWRDIGGYARLGVPLGLGLDSEGGNHD